MTFDIMHQALQPVIDFLHTHPHYSGLITFFVVFCEAMAVIGVVVPGSITMTAIGVLAGSGVIPIVSTLIWGICGGIVGDYLSFLLGVHYKDRLHRMWPFKKHPQLLTYGESFIAKHGGKSIIISRSVGPMRCMIPMVAGMLKMPTHRFLLAAIPSVSIWAILYIFPGILLGALAQELPPKVATQFMLWAMLCVVILWIIIWLAQHFLRQICCFFDFYIMRLWTVFNRVPKLQWLTNFLADPNNPDNHQQLTLLLVSIASVIALFVVMLGVMNHSWITSLNLPIYNLLHSIRTETGDKIMLGFTMFAETKAIVIAEIIFFSWLIKRHYWYTLAHAVILFGLCLVCSAGIKLLVHCPRPDDFISYYPTDFSFPSFHTAASITVYGFLAMIIARELKNLRWVPYTIAATITALIIISRLYLGSHWLTDILGSIFLGLAILFPITISYRRRHPIKIPPIKTAIVAACIFGGIISLNSLLNFQYKLQNFYSTPTPIKIIDLKTWHSQTNNKPITQIPFYRTDRLGHPINAFNIQWLGDINHIEQHFLQRGWQSYPTQFNLRELLRHLAIHKGTEHPILPQLYNNRPETLLMTKSLGKNKPQLLLHLWDSNIIINKSSQRLWLGVIEYYAPESPSTAIKNLKGNHHKSKKFIDATSELLPYLDNFKWHRIVDDINHQPIEMRKLDWDGNVLLIEE